MITKISGHLHTRGVFEYMQGMSSDDAAAVSQKTHYDADLLLEHLPPGMAGTERANGISADFVIGRL